MSDLLCCQHGPFRRACTNSSFINFMQSCIGLLLRLAGTSITRYERVQCTNQFQFQNCRDMTYAYLSFHNASARFVSSCQDCVMMISMTIVSWYKKFYRHSSVVFIALQMELLRHAWYSRSHISRGVLPAQNADISPMRDTASCWQIASNLQ